MRYYVYISDAKVDMLLPQISNKPFFRTSWEIKVDFKLFSALRKSESGKLENRIKRLEKVSKFIRKNANVGSADEPGEYVFDTLEMKWAIEDHGDSAVVYFVGEIGSTFVALGGSVEHVVGTAPKPNYPKGIGSLPSSSMPWLLREYESIGKENSFIKDQSQWADRAIRDGGPPFVRSQRLEFLAKRLMFWPANGKDQFRNCLLATPLYVALVD